jgi:perosamine synthetase
MNVIPYSRQHITPDDEAAVLKVLRSDYITRGPVTRELEDALCELTGKKHAVVVSNGTVALWAAFEAISEHRIITPVLTFAGVAVAAMLAGVSVDFADVYEETLCTHYWPASNNVTAFAPMDYGGYPSLRHKLGRTTILDACHSIGATINGESNTKHADIAVGSGHAVKQISGSELGWLVTDSDEYAARLRRSRDIGRENGQFVSHSLNLHTSEINAALYYSQLKRLPQNLERRREIASRYYATLGQDFRLILPVDDPGHAWHLYVIRLSEWVNCSSDQFQADLRELGIGTQKHYLPIHRQPIFYHRAESYPIAEHAYDRMLSIPMYYGLTDEEQDKVIESINIVLDRYSK